MARTDPLRPFIQAALAAGRSRVEIREALVRAGWLEREINRGLDAFDEQDFLPPVPRPVVQLTARETFVYAVMFTALAVTASSLVSLVHAILNLRMPDPADPPYLFFSAMEGARWAIATLVVSTPIFVWVTEATGRGMARDPSLRMSPVRKGLTYLTLFVAGFIFLGDAAYSIFSLLRGELTQRFLLKAMTVAVVTGSIFVAYLSGIEEAKGE